MGRDWAPWEQYASEQENIATGRGDYWHFLKNTVFHSASGEKIRLCSDEELTLRKQFPILGKLMCSNGDYSFTSLYDKLSKIDGGLDLLSRKDKELAEFIAYGKGDENCYLIKWFLGKLDPEFYYSEHNHHLFGESLLNEAVLHANKDKSVVSLPDGVKSINKIIADASAASKQKTEDKRTTDLNFEKE